MQILLDADIVLEWILNRSPIIEEIEILWYLINNNVIECYITKIGLSKVRLVLSEFNERKANDFIRYLEGIVEVCPIDSSLLQKARKYQLDFETAVEIECAKQKQCYYITQKPSELITRYHDKVPQLMELWDLLGREFARKMNDIIRLKATKQATFLSAILSSQSIRRFPCDKSASAYLTTPFSILPIIPPPKLFNSGGKFL